MKIKALSTIFSVILISLILSLSAVADSEVVSVEIDGTLVYYNNHTGFPFVDEAYRTQVPLRKTMESFGAKVNWDNATQTATIKKDNTVVQVIFGRKYIVVNNENIPTDTEPMMINDRTYLPIRAVAEAFGATVGWDNITQTVSIERPIDPNKPSIGSVEVVNGKERTLTFYDDFDGDSLDTTKWTYAPMWRRGDLNGYWNNNMTRLDGNGNLVLSVDKFDDTQYISGAIQSQDRFEQAYGYFEIRCQLHKETGFWSAFWLMSDRVYNVDGSGRDGTEIDIYESPYPTTDTINQALHWDGYNAEHQSSGNKVKIPDIYEGFHTFAVDWEPDKYTFYIDGKKTWETKAGGVCQEPMYMIISTEIGTWAGTLKEKELPANILVDYVKVYK